MSGARSTGTRSGRTTFLISRLYPPASIPSSCEHLSIASFPTLRWFKLYSRRTSYLPNAEFSIRALGSDIFPDLSKILIAKGRRSPSEARSPLLLRLGIYAIDSVIENTKRKVVQQHMSIEHLLDFRDFYSAKKSHLFLFLGSVRYVGA